MGVADEQGRLLREPRGVLGRARRDSATWAGLAFSAQGTDEGDVTDRNGATRFGVLWALQYDRRPEDLPLLRFLLRQQITLYQETESWGLPSDLTLAGFLLAERRQVEDLWLHWDARNLGFDTVLGYDIRHLLTGGVAATVEAVRASSHPDRDHILDEVASARHTDATVNAWLEHQRTLFPADPVGESLESWASRAADLGERGASRLFITEWATGEPRTGRTLNVLQFHLAHLGYFTEAVAVQKEAIAICDDPPGSRHIAGKLLDLARLERQAGQFAAARQTLQAAERTLSALPDWPWTGMGLSFVKEHFLLVPVAPDEHMARLLLNEADQYLLDAPQQWLNGVLDSAIAAAGHLDDEDKVGRYRALRAVDRHQREQRPSPGSTETP